MRSLLSPMHHCVQRAQARGESRLPALREAQFEGQYRRLLKIGWKANPPPPLPSVKKRGKLKQSPARNLGFINQ